MCFKEYEVDRKELELLQKKIAEIVQDCDFGSITIHIQNGKAVYIDKLEKFKIK